MVLARFTPRRVAPFLLQGAYGAHIVTRMWQLSKQPPSSGPLYSFLLKNTDVILVLTGMPFVWHIVHRSSRAHPNPKLTAQSHAREPAHHLRQVFTVLLLGLGLLRRRIIGPQPRKVFDIIERLERVIAEGIEALNILDPPDALGNGSDALLEG